MVGFFGLVWGFFFWGGGGGCFVLLGVLLLLLLLFLGFWGGVGGGEGVENFVKWVLIVLRYALTSSTSSLVSIGGRSSRYHFVSMGVSLVAPRMTVMASFCTLPSFSRLDCDRIVRPTQ